MKPNYRRCISCRKVAPKDAFWRVVRVYPSKNVQLDRGMGRSAYICPAANCLQVARKKGKLDRALKATVPEHLYETLSRRLSGLPQPITELGAKHKLDPAPVDESPQI